MNLGYYPEPIIKNTVSYGGGGYFADGFPDYYFDPPLGSDWAIILWLWPHVVNHIFPDVTLPSGLNINGFRADCNAATTVPGPRNSRDDTRQTIGETVVPGWQYPFLITGISNPANTQQFTPREDGSLASHPTAGNNIDAFGDLVIAIISAGTGAIVGGAVAAGGAAASGGGTGATSLTSTDVATIYSDAGYTGDVASVGDTAGAGLGTTADTAIPGTAGNPMELPSDLTPNYVPPAPVDAVTPLSAADLAAAAPSVATISASDLQAALNAGLASSAIPTAGSVLPSAGQIVSAAGTIGKLIGGTGSGNAGGGLFGNGSNDNGLIASTSSGNMTILLAAGIAAFLLLRK